MERSCALFAACALATVVGGCGSKGSYELSWRFTDQAAGEAPTARECGLRGVDGFSVAGSNDAGDNDVFKTPCGTLSVVRRVPAGHWLLLVVATDRTGQV